MFTLNTRTQLTEIAAKNNIRCLILNSNIGKTDTFYVLRLFAMIKQKDKLEIPIFFSSEDFELMNEVLSEFPNANLQILNTPIDTKDLVKKIQIAALGKITAPSLKDHLIQDKLKVDLEFMNVFITTTKKIIAEMTHLVDLIHSPPILMSKVKDPLDIAISSKILISSVFFKGSYYIAFPKQTFLNFYEIVVMEKCTEINNENKDLASELANIIYGQCKKKFSNEGLHLEMIIPSVHMGEINYSIVILIPFECSLGKFYLAVAPGHI